MTTALERGEGLASRPGRSLPRERPGTHCTGGWVGRSGQVQKISPPPEFDPRTVQPVASRYTDYATRLPYATYYEIHALSTLASSVLAIKRKNTFLLYYFSVLPGIKITWQIFSYDL